MKINEIEERLNISRANVRFYEKEGLINPERGANGYRNYSDEDVAFIKKIIIFRKLGLSLADIKDIFAGKLSLEAAIDRNIENLNEQIKELNGALEVSKIIKKEETSYDNFEEEYYWELINTKESQGQYFVELVKDYMTFEKQSFWNMWKYTFFYDIKGIEKKHGIFITIGIVILICVLRGLAKEFLWSGSFIDGFTYPFVLFAFISLITLPIYLLNRKYKCEDSTEDAEKPKKSPIETAIKVVAAILYIPIVIFIVPSIIGDIVAYFCVDKGGIYIISQGFYFIYFIATMYLLFMMIFLFSKNGIHIGEYALKARIPKKAKGKVVIFSSLVFVVAILIYSTWFNCFTEEEIRIQRFVYSKEYSWADVDHYTIKANADGTLKYCIVMNDGKELEILGGDVSVDNLPEEQYPDSTDDFCRQLTKKFAEQGIELKVENWDKLFDKLTYEYWIEYAEEIKNISEDNK